MTGADKIAAIVLAAGRSSRMGEDNKLVAQIRGKALVRHAVDAVLESAAGSVVVVTGFEAEKIAENLKGLPVSMVHNDDFAQGISSSLKSGLAALADDMDGVIVCLADMPDINADHLNRLIRAFDPDQGRSVCVASYAGQRGNPVLWSRRFFPEMMELSGDEGARKLLHAHERYVHLVDVESDAVLRDVDTPEALDAIKRRNT